MSAAATPREISAQPDIWRGWSAELAAQAAATRDWITQIAPRQIWLSGAGTSAFVGDLLAPGLPAARAVPTTDIVACPGQFLGAQGPILAVQFGRSGDSSETVGMLDLLDQHRPDIHRLHITCNPAGALATRAAPGLGQMRALVLPEATHDAGFAMTSSFSTMALSALTCLDPSFDAATLTILANRAQRLLDHLWAMPAPRPTRAVFLGAGAFTGAARESALKVSELTAGQTATLWDSPLGFRHGPKAFVDDSTQLFILTHPDPHTRLFEDDLAAEIARQFPAVPITRIGDGGDLDIASSGHAAADAVMAVLPAQVLAARWSAEMGLNVDNPFEAHGNLTRVVSGVTLHPWGGA